MWVPRAPDVNLIYPLELCLLGEREPYTEHAGTKPGMGQQPNAFIRGTGRGFQERLRPPNLQWHDNHGVVEPSLRVH